MNLKGKTAVVCGGGGFIGGHLVRSLVENGAKAVRAVDIKPKEEWYQIIDGVESLSLDLKDKQNCLRATEGIEVCTSWPLIWVGWGLLRTTRPSAC